MPAHFLAALPHFLPYLGTSIVLLPLMRWGLRLNRIEGGLLLLVYGCYLAVLWPK